MHWQYLLILASGASAYVGGHYNQLVPRADDRSDTCNCTGTHDNGTAGIGYICRDLRLGPSCLPRTWPLLSFVSDYDRFGNLTPGEFLDKYIWKDGKYKDDYHYPDDHGFLLDINKKPIVANYTLPPGLLVDRFGNENGKYLSAADAPFSQRSLPPEALNNPGGYSRDYPDGYHVYRVLNNKNLTVETGPIAPAFGQPGLGVQFYTGHTGKISYLVANKYLERVNLSDIVIGPGKGGACGL